MSENELYESLVGFGKADSFLSLEPTDLEQAWLKIGGENGL